MVTVNNGLRSDPFSFCRYRDCHAVFIRTAEEKNIALFCTLVPNVDIRRQICPGQMTQMKQAVGVRQSRRHKNTLIL